MKRIYFEPFPLLATERLILRKLEPEDSKCLQSLRSDERVNKYLNRPSDITAKQADEFIEKINNGIKRDDWIFWAISVKGQNELIGTICLWNFNDEKTAAEIGYELHPDYQGRGFMGEAVQKVVEFGLNEINLSIIKAHTNKNNDKSTALLKRSGFRLSSMRGEIREKDESIFFIKKIDEQF